MATLKTIPELLKEFADGQSVGSIKPAFLRDLVASISAMTVQPPVFGMVQTFDYVPARDGLAILKGGPTSAGYASYAASNPTAIWEPRNDPVDGSTPDSRGSNVLSSGTYDLESDPEYAWSNGFSPFAIDSNGNLRIRCQQISTVSPSFAANEIPINPVTGSAFTYVSGTLNSSKTFNQVGGYFEVIAQCPTGYACWPALWLFPTNGKGPPEIDLLEVVGGINPVSTYQVTSHYAGSNNSFAQTAVVLDVGQDIGAGFHKYAVKWTDTAITYYYDDVQVATFDPSTHPDLLTPMCFHLDMQLGSNIGGWVPAPNGTTPAQSDLLIKSVRAWQFVGPTNLSLSAASYVDNLTVGGTVATISAQNAGGNSNYTFSKVTDPDSMFTLSGSNLNLAQSVPATTASSHAVTLKVTDSLGKTRQRLFNIGVVTATPIQANYISSQNLQNALWSPNNTTVTSADTFVETTANGQHQVFSSLITRTAGVKTFNGWVEATPSLTRTAFVLQIFDGAFSNQAVAWFDLSAQAMTFVNATGAFTTASASLTPLSNGSFRCALKFTTDASSTGLRFTIGLMSPLGTTSYTGSTAAGLKIDNPWLYNTGAGAGGT